MYCTIEAVKLTTDRYEASRDLFATAELLVDNVIRVPAIICIWLTIGELTLRSLETIHCTKKQTRDANLPGSSTWAE